MTEKAVIYARFSSDKQREESIEDQVRVCSQFAASNGFEIVKTYTDEARSGTNAAGRPGFQKMILDAQAQRWTKVIVYKPTVSRARATIQPSTRPSCASAEWRL